MTDSTQERDRQAQEQRRLESQDRGRQERRTWRTEDRPIEGKERGSKKLDVVVREAHAGLWGSGDQMRGRLSRHGYDAEEVARGVAKYRKVL